MTLETLREFFFWNTVINGGILVVSSLIILCARGWIYRLHAWMFRMSEEEVASSLYKIIGFYKIFIYAFNAVPYIALRIIS